MTDDRFARYGLLASAIAGRVLEVAPAGPGEASHTDGTTVFLDAELADPGQLRAALAVQAALVGSGSLEASVVDRLVRRPVLARRYLSIEGRRALGQLDELLPVSLRHLVEHTKPSPSHSPDQSLAVASGPGPFEDPPAVFGTIEPKKLATARSRGAGEPLARHVPRGGRREPAELVSELTADPGVEVPSSPVEGQGVLGRLLGKLLGDAPSRSGGPPGADAPTRLSPKAGGAGRRVSVSSADPAVGHQGPPAGGAGFVYPEWDGRRRRYKARWCTVLESEPPPAELGSFGLPDTHRLRGALGRLGLDFERRRRQLQGDDVDVDAAVEAHVERRAGVAPGEALYIDTLRRKRDLSVLVLLDVSASAGEPGAAGVAVHEHQRAAAGALVGALHELGDRVALYGFRSQGRAAVHLIALKRFDDALDAVVLERMGGLVPGAYTRLGAAVRHGTAVLEQQAGTARRLLVVVSDGLAYDHGYEPAYGEADSRRALVEARRRGIGCLCLSVGAATDAGALRRVFGTAAHAALERHDQLPAVAGPLLRSALGSAERQRSAFVRWERSHERQGAQRRPA